MNKQHSNFVAFWVPSDDLQEIIIVTSKNRIEKKGYYVFVNTRGVANANKNTIVGM